MLRFLKLAAVISALMVSTAGAAQKNRSATDKPTVVLVHGAFAESSSWTGVIKQLQMDGYPVVAVANPLRGVKSDGAYVRSFVSSLKTDVVLVGHSYGGLVINEAASGINNVRSLVFVAAFSPDVGESAATLSSKFPGSTLAPTLADPIPLTGEVHDLYIDQAKFHDQFAADVPNWEARLMAATQRPITDAALTEASSTAAWKTTPSWFVYGDADKNIPVALLDWMSQRAHSRGTVSIKGGSHVIMVSNPVKVARVIEDAAGER